MKRTLTTLDIIALIGLSVYNAALILGMLSFGREMGDLGYSAILIFGTLAVLFLYVLKYKGVWNKHTWVLSGLALTLLLFIFYHSSFGRGPDFPWNGQFFS